MNTPSHHPHIALSACQDMAPGQLVRLLELQRSIIEALARGSCLEETLDRLCLLIEEMVPNTLASVMLFDTSRERLRVKAGPSFPESALIQFDGIIPGTDMGSCGNAALSGRPTYVSNVPRDPRWDGLRAAAEQFAISSCWSIPILDDQNEVLGTFAITSTEPGEPDTFHRQLLKTASYLAGIAIMHQQREERLAQWNTVFSDATEGMVITDTKGRILDVNHAFTRITGYSLDEVKGKNPRILKSGRHEESFYRAMWRSLVETGRWRGEIWNRRKQGDIYPEWLSISRVRDRTGATSNYVAVFSDISALKESERKLYHLAHHDPLTGLPNRLLMSARLEHLLDQQQRNATSIAVIFIDLDRFKNINDSYGHPFGDQLLIEVANRLRASLRRQDTIARLGGDEFVIILEQLNHMEDAATVANTCITALDQPFLLDGRELYITPSIGVTLSPEDGRDSETLLKNADIAMYRAKARGGNQFSFYKRGMTDSVKARIDNETLLRRALERQEFELHYQPQLSADGRRVVGAEALLRWRHPDKGLVAPGEFIPILEETRLIEPVGAWVLEEGCRRLHHWIDSGLPPMRLGLNLSAHQMSNGNLLKRLEEIIHTLDLDPALVELEITEHSLMDSPRDAVTLLETLGALGISLAIDNFGTGYSSLARLKQLPVHCLKIDRTLVRDIRLDADDQAICGAVIALGHSLGMRVLAEGVEHEDQRRQLEQMGCDELQGFLLGRPMPEEVFQAWLRERTLTPGDNAPPGADSSPPSS